MLWRHDKFHANDGAAEIYDGILDARPVHRLFLLTSCAAAMIVPAKRGTDRKLSVESPPAHVGLGSRPCPCRPDFPLSSQGADEPQARWLRSTGGSKWHTASFVLHGRSHRNRTDPPEANSPSVYGRFGSRTGIEAPRPTVDSASPVPAIADPLDAAPKAFRVVPARDSCTAAKQR